MRGRNNSWGRSDLVFVFLACNRKFLSEKIGFGLEKDRFVLTRPAWLKVSFHTMLVRGNFSYHACQRQLFKTFNTLYLVYNGYKVSYYYTNTHISIATCNKKFFFEKKLVCLEEVDELEGRSGRLSVEGPLVRIHDARCGGSGGGCCSGPALLSWMGCTP